MPVSGVKVKRDESVTSFFIIILFKINFQTREGLFDSSQLIWSLNVLPYLKKKQIKKLRSLPVLPSYQKYVLYIGLLKTGISFHYVLSV